MKFFADFHIHSKYSRATSKDLDLGCLDKWAKIKGIKVLGTGDFTHPLWFKALREGLEPAESGLFKLKKSSLYSSARSGRADNETRFILTVEISCIYSKNGKVRKIHILVFSPSFEICEKINAQLSEIGNLKADGRPILGLDAKELAKIVLNTSPDCLIVPAHLMTPWFSLFGSKSGFDSLEECFEEYSKYIFAGETGLSADPSMLWRMPDGRRITLLSNSDAHSGPKLGREANFFDTDVDYFKIIDAIKTRNPSKFLHTIEFFPEEGKYYYDGHRLCGVRTAPEETKKYKNICPVCAQPLTVGVLNRVEELSDKPKGFKPEGFIPFKNLVPLQEIIADAFGQLPGTKRVAKEYQKLIENFGNEFKILLDVASQDLRKFALPEVAEGIIKVREGKVVAEPGYDGVFGKIKSFSGQQQKQISKQKALF